MRRLPMRDPRDVLRHANRVVKMDVQCDKLTTVVSGLVANKDI